MWFSEEVSIYFLQVKESSWLYFEHSSYTFGLIETNKTYCSEVSSFIKLKENEE